LTFTADQRALAAKLENILLKVWPSHSTVMKDGWALRLAGGYSGRANSASALMVGAGLSEQLLHYIEAHYAEAKLLPTVRVTPVAAGGIGQKLHNCGYKLQSESLTQIAALDRDHVYAEHLGLATQAHDVWLEGVCRSQSGLKRFPDKLHDIVGRITVPRRFATLRLDGKPVAFGLCAIDQGWAEIGCVMVDETRRGQGCGPAIVSGLMQWAKDEGATSAFLQVDANNLPALALYKSLGFETLYPYETWCLE
jgi:N-acetylglutamate synthase